MKKLYLLLVLNLLRLAAFAQQPDSLSLRLNAVFANVDKSQVPTGLLADYALPLMPLASFNGTLADSTRTNPTLFRALYATAYTSCIYGANPLATLPAYNAQVEAVEATSSTIIPIMVQRLDYASLRPDALSQNLLSVQNNQLYDVPGRLQSPYQTRALFAAAPSREYASSGTVTFLLPRSLYVEYLAASPGASLRSLEVDAGDGYGYRTTSWEQRLVVSYGTAGSKRIKVRFTYQQSIRLVAYESQFDLYVPQVGSQSLSSPTARTNNLASLANDSVTFAAAPGQAAGKAYIRYADSRQTSHKLVKPLIVLEGYDQHYIAPHIASKNYSLDQFLKEINTSTNTSAFDLRNALTNTGDYDIVFVDYANGTDDILLNAGLFEQVLNYVNTNKDPASTEQNVVMGMSMGGLIGRYKLAQLEKANPGSTHVRLLVLQDSPQRGANVPLGISAAIRQANNCFLRGIALKDINKYIQEGVALLDQPATRQLVKYQTLGPNNGDFFANTFVDGPYRQMINYAAPYKIVAVSQGSQCGVSLFPPYTELLRASGSSFNGVLGYIIQTYLRYIPGFGGEVVLNALPDGGQSARVSGLYLYTQIRILRFIPIRVTLTRQNFSCPTGLLPLDGAAGSTEPLAGGPPVITGGSPGWLSPIFSLQYAARTRFSFVQPASALDIADFTQPSLSAKYINGVTSFSTTSTNSFIAQEQTNLFGNNDFNVPHLTFTARNGEFIFDQLEGKKLANNYCATECLAPSALVIGGPLTLCGSGTYTTPVQGPGITYTWTASPASAVTVATGTGSTFTTGNSGNSNDYVTITLQIGGACPLTITLQVKLGAPETPGIGALDTFDGCTYQFATFQIFNYDPTLSYQLSASGSISLRSQLRADGTFNVKGGGRGGIITVTASNGCGTTTSRNDFTFEPCSNFAAYPNPASTELTVASTDPATGKPVETAPDYDADLYDTYGKKIKTKHSSHGKAVLDVRDLPDGLYNLRVGQGKDAHSQHIQVKH